MKKFYFILYYVFFLCSSALAHQASIKGVVYGQGTNTPLVGATVVIPQIDAISTTNQLGQYAFYNVVPGNYELKISYLGFVQETRWVAVDNIAPLKIISHLQAGSLQLSEVAISASQDKALNLISAVDLQVRPIQNSQEILRLVPGLFIAQHAGGGKAEQIFLRGFDIDHGTDVNITTDGIPVNMVSHAHGQGYADLHFIIPETVQAVDYGKGPYQADKGNFATAGYADFRTKAALDKNLIKLEAGRFNTYRAVGLFNLLGAQARARHQQAYLATEYLFSNGYFKSSQGLNRLNGFGRYQGIFRNNLIINASVSAFQSNWNASGQIPERAVNSGIISRFGSIDDTEGGLTSRYNANIILDKTWANSASLRQQVYFSKYDFELYSNFTFFLNDPQNGDQIRQRENRQIYGYNNSYQREITLFGRPLRSDVGLGLRYDIIKGSELSRTLNRQITLTEIKKGDTHELNAFAYLSQTLEISPRWSINAALRFDQFNFNYQNRLNDAAANDKQSASPNRVSPKLNFTYTHSPKLQFYLKSGVGFHANDARVSVNARYKAALPGARGTDLGLSFLANSKLLVNSALWYLALDQELVYVGDEGVVEPSGKTRRYGLDFSARYQINNYLILDTDLNLAKPRFLEEEKGNNFIPLAPTFTSTGGLTYTNNKKVKGSLRYRYLGHRAANEDYSLTAEGYFLLDALVSYTYKKVEFKLTGENLLNSNWKEAQFETESRLKTETEPISEIHFTPGTPFFIRAGIAYSF